MSIFFVGCSLFLPLVNFYSIVVLICSGAENIGLKLFGAEKMSPRQLEKNILDRILGGTYDNKIRPSGANGTGTLGTKYFSVICMRLYYFYINGV